MVIDVAATVVFLFAAIYLLINAQQLAARPRRGTAARPSKRVLLGMAAACLLVAVGSLVNLITR
jgi:hypothetical protein